MLPEVVEVEQQVRQDVRAAARGERNAAMSVIAASAVWLAMQPSTP